MNLISLPVAGAFALATKAAIEYAPCGPHDKDRLVAPSIWIEGLFAEAPVPDPTRLAGIPLMVKCLGVQEFLAAALQLLVDEGLCTTVNDEGDEEPMEYMTYDQLKTRADALIEELKDDATLRIADTSFEWLEGYANRAADADIAWFHTVTLEAVTKPTNNLAIYFDIKLVINHHATEAVRIDPTGMFYSIVGQGGRGGQLLDAVRAFYFPGAQAGQLATTTFIARRLVDFFIDTRWPAVYNIYSNDLDTYAFELPRRAMWKTATSQEWAALIQNRLGPSIQKGLPIMARLMQDILDEPSRLVREVQAMGELILAGEMAEKQVFWHIERVEEQLTEHYQGLIESERDEGADTAAILAKLSLRARGMRQDRDGKGSEAKEGDMRGPKPGQLLRATTDVSFTQLEAKFMPQLQGDRMTNEDKLILLNETLTAETNLPRAVLFDAKGVRITLYIGQGSDFLSLLYGERHLMSFYLGQSLAYDEDLEEVPSDLRTHLFDAKQTKIITDIEWADERAIKLDFLNGCYLKLCGDEIGTKFHRYDPKNIFHDGEMLTHMQDLYGKLFAAFGYPSDVPRDDGMTYRAFIGSLKRIQKAAVALPPEQQKGAHAMIDAYALRGYQAAAANFKRVVYGPSPADKKLRAWLRADEPVHIELLESLAALKETSTFMRRTGSIFGPKAKAASLPGYTVINEPGAGHSKRGGGRGSSQETQPDMHYRGSRGGRAVRGGRASRGRGGGRGGGSSVDTPLGEDDDETPLVGGRGGGGKGKGGPQKTKTPAGKAYVLYTDGNLSNGAPPPHTTALPPHSLRMATAWPRLGPARHTRRPAHAPHWPRPKGNKAPQGQPREQRPRPRGRAAPQMTGALRAASRAATTPKGQWRASDSRRPKGSLESSQHAPRAVERLGP